MKLTRTLTLALVPLPLIPTLPLPLEHQVHLHPRRPSHALLERATRTPRLPQRYISPTSPLAVHLPTHFSSSFPLSLCLRPALVLTCILQRQTQS